MKVVQALFSAVQVGQRRFNCIVCLVNLAHAPFNARKDLESTFEYCAGPFELVHAPFSARKDLESSFNHSKARACRF